MSTKVGHASKKLSHTKDRERSYKLGVRYEVIEKCNSCALEAGNELFGCIKDNSACKFRKKLI